MINIESHATDVTLEQLPQEAQSLIRENEFYKEEAYFTLKHLKYPKNTPIAFSHIEYDFELYSGIYDTYNLNEIEIISCFASGVSVYEKANKNEKAYALFQYDEYGYNNKILIIIEI